MPSLMGDIVTLCSSLFHVGLARFLLFRCLRRGCQQCVQPWVSAVSLLIGCIRAVNHGWHLLPCAPVVSTWAWRGSRNFAAFYHACQQCFVPGVTFVALLMGGIRAVTHG